MPGPNTKLEYLRDFCKSRGYCDNCPVKDPNDECWVELEGKLTTYYERAFDENARIRIQKQRDSEQPRSACTHHRRRK